MKSPEINIKNLEQGYIMNFEPSVEELKKIEEEIDNLTDKWN